MIFLSARYANPERTAVLVETVANGFEIVSPADRPERWAAVLASNVEIAPYTAPPEPILTRVSKADLWRRLTDGEADLLYASLQAAPLRLRLIFEAAQFIDTGDDNFPALRSGIVEALGEQRAAEVLAPTN